MRVAACLMPAALMATTLLIGACDKHSPPPEQATQQANVPAAAPAAASTAHALDRSRKGTTAPTLVFAGPDGKPTTLAAFRGKPVLLNLWATWCGPCVKELPTLDALAGREAGRVQVVALSQDMQADKVAPFFAARHLATLKPYTDPKMGWVPMVADNLPTSILYDSAGREVWRTVGDLDWTGAVATNAVREAT